MSHSCALCPFPGDTCEYSTGILPWHFDHLLWVMESMLVSFPVPTTTHARKLRAWGHWCRFLVLQAQQSCDYLPIGLYWDHVTICIDSYWITWWCARPRKHFNVPKPAFPRRGWDLGMKLKAHVHVVGAMLQGCVVYIMIFWKFSIIIVAVTLGTAGLQKMKGVSLHFLAVSFYNNGELHL